jgi:hypothetical protein
MSRGQIGPEDEAMKVLKSYEWKGNGGRKSTHDWDTILDGKLRATLKGRSSRSTS